MIPALFLATLLGFSPALSPSPPVQPDIRPDTADIRTEEVRFRSGDLTLAALLFVPDGEGSYPGAFLIQGSGPSDRDNAWARAIAEELARSGIATLLPDKRGTGASDGDWRRADFGDRAGDALAGLRWMQGRSDIRGGEIGLVGLSQGGWVAPVAASRSDDVDFVVDVSGAAVSFAEQSFHEMRNTARQAGLPDSLVSEVLRLNRLAGQYALHGTWEPYERARTAALEGPWARIARGFPADRNAPIWTFIRGVADFDPMPYWLSVDQPVLVLYGARDEADNVPVTESVRRLRFAFDLVGKENRRIRTIPDAGHGFRTNDGQLMPEFVEELTSWIEVQTRGGG